MSKKDRTVQVGTRIPEGLVAKIDKIVEETVEYSSRSDFILCAVRDLIARLEERN